MKIETLSFLDTYIHDTRVWNYPACYKVDDKTKDYLTDIYNGIDSSEGYVIFRL